MEEAWKRCDGVALVSAPWPLFNRPSIQMGTLKSYLGQHCPEVRVDAHHLYLQVADGLGFDVYHSISERSWLAETVYAALLFPERIDALRGLFTREARIKGVLRECRFEDLVEQVGSVSQSLIEETNWAAYGLVGFSVCLCQLTASLYFMRKIKERHRDLVIVAGGSSWVEESAGAWFRHFPEIDYLILGEGEIPLLELVRHLRVEPWERSPFSSTSILSSSGNVPPERSPSFSQLQNLDALPTPDYDDYFQTLQTLPSGCSFHPTLPVEISRGCWWKRRDQGGKGGCAFCNLNLQWEGYRSKSPRKAVWEVDALTTRYRALSVALMDNVLPLGDIPELFGGLGRLGKDLQIFAEVRASLSAEALQNMRKAGLEELQVGIEALSTRLLTRMNKGTTAIQNLEIMKWCEQWSVTNTSNLIMEFPGSDEEDVRETLRALEFAEIYRPLKPVRFWLGLDSPVYSSPNSHGIQSTFNHPRFAVIFPEAVFREARFVIQGYRGNRRRQTKLWRPVVQRLKAWETNYKAMMSYPGCGPALSYRDGGEFMLIRQRRPRAASVTHRLVGTSREIYLYCRKHRSVAQILRRFPGAPQDKLGLFLKGLVEKKLMFQEGDRYLSLAVAWSRS